MCFKLDIFIRKWSTLPGPSSCPSSWHISQSLHESFTKLILIWHIHKRRLSSSWKSMVWSSRDHSQNPNSGWRFPFAKEQNQWLLLSVLMLFERCIMHKPFAVVGPFVSGPWKTSADDEGPSRRRVSSETASMAHPLSTVWPIIDHHVDNAAQLSSVRSKLVDSDGQMHSSWQINHRNNAINNHTPATQNKWKIYNCFPGSLWRMSPRQLMLLLSSSNRVGAAQPQRVTGQTMALLVVHILCNFSLKLVCRETMESRDNKNHQRRIGPEEDRSAFWN